MGEIQESATMEWGNASAVTSRCLIFRAMCFVMLRKKKEAAKAITLYKRYKPESFYSADLAMLESVIAMMPQRGRPHARSKQKHERVTTRMKCSNPTCTNVEARPREFNVCARCKTAKYCGLKCQKLHWKAGHKKFCKEAL